MVMYKLTITTISSLTFAINSGNAGLDAPTIGGGIGAHNAQDEKEEACQLEHDFEYYLTLTKKEFEGPNGWRNANQNGECALTAAKLIERYILHSRPAPPESITSLRWHAGQAYAIAGESSNALKFMRASHQSGSDYYSITWNYYVDGTIAFLQNDRDGLFSALAGLRSTEIPSEVKQQWKEILDKDPTAEFAAKMLTERPNENILVRLSNCFHQPYNIAYTAQCDQ